MSKMHETDKEFDLLVRSMMENAEEEVPSRVWSRVSSRLDAGAAARPVVRWWRPVAVALSAAAVLALGVFAGLRLLPQQTPSAERVAEIPAAEAGREGGLIAVAPAAEELAAPASSEAYVPSSVTPAAPVAPAVPDATSVMSDASTVMPDPDRASHQATEQASKATEPSVMPDSDRASQQATEQASGDPRTQSGVTSTDTPDATTVKSDASSVKSDPDRASQQPTEPTAAAPAAPSADPFAQMAFEDSRKAARRAGPTLSLGGQLQTNANPSAISGFNGRKAIGNAAPAKTTIEQTSLNSSYAVPVTLGVSVRFPLPAHWSITTGVNWSMLARTFTGVYYEVENGSVVSTVNTDFDNTLHYIGIPLTVGYTFVDRDRLSVYAFAGGTIEKGLVNVYRGNSASGPINFRQSVPGIQGSVTAGFGIQLRLSKLVGLYLDPSVHYWFPSGQPVSIRTQQPFGVGFEAGLRFNL